MYELYTYYFRIGNLKKLEEERRTIRESLGNNSIQRFTIDRLSVVDDVFQVYRMRPYLFNHEIRVKFQNERGLDGGGLTRELFPLFWSAVEGYFFDGNIEKVPLTTPRPENDYVILGKILSHGFVLTSYFPTMISIVCASYLVSGSTEMSNDVLLQSFLNFVDTHEARALNLCLSAKRLLEEEKEDVIALFSRLHSTTIPTSENLEQLIYTVAKFTLIIQPFFVLERMRRGMIESHRSLWQTCDPEVTTQLFQALLPTTTQVWDMVSEPVLRTPNEAKMFDFFRRFVFSLSIDFLCRLLQFITGKPQCSLNTIKVSFCQPASDFERRPTASTCGMTICLPTTYASFASFSREFKEILQNSQMWSFDAL